LGEPYAGIDVINGVVADFKTLGVVEPLKVKEQIIKSATETANLILRIDNVVAVSRSHEAPSMPPQGGMDMY
jgi:chaperonin GroEL (HSP60 family)